MVDRMHNAANSEPRAGETLEFRPNMTRILAVNALIALTAGFILTFFLHFPGGAVSLSHGAATLATLAVALISFLMLTAPCLSPDATTRVRISPKGIAIERRDGSSDTLTWSEIRGYVHQKDAYIFLTQGDGVPLQLIGFSKQQLPLLRDAIRAPLTKGSMEWRGQAASSVPRGFNWPVALCFVLVLGGGALVHYGHRDAAATLFAVVAVFVIGSIIATHRRKGRD